MEVHLTNEVQSRLEQLAAETGLTKDDFVQDAMAGYFDELTRLRETLDSRYDDIESGKVKLIPGDEVAIHFRRKSAAFRSLNS